ncbi:MAG: hypothetical protein J3K34DRAFT_405185 [Monoraphidium minutum]|nr:MAG: hypothetical protein J3K34DRAFT_405185 [Monoraphidium minutum]
MCPSWQTIKIGHPALKYSCYAAAAAPLQPLRAASHTGSRKPARRSAGPAPPAAPLAAPRHWPPAAGRAAPSAAASAARRCVLMPCRLLASPPLCSLQATRAASYCMRCSARPLPLRPPRPAHPSPALCQACLPLRGPKASDPSSASIGPPRGPSLHRPSSEAPTPPPKHRAFGLTNPARPSANPPPRWAHASRRPRLPPAPVHHPQCVVQPMLAVCGASV